MISNCISFFKHHKATKWILLQQPYWHTHDALTIETRIKPNQWSEWINLPKYQRFMVTLCHYLSIHAIFILYLWITVNNYLIMHAVYGMPICPLCTYIKQIIYYYSPTLSHFCDTIYSL